MEKSSIKQVSKKEKMIDIKGILKDLFRTESIKIVEQNDREQKQWEAENKEILDNAKDDIHNLEMLFNYPDKKKKGAKRKEQIKTNNASVKIIDKQNGNIEEFRKKEEEREIG